MLINNVQLLVFFFDFFRQFIVARRFIFAQTKFSSGALNVE